MEAHQRRGRGPARAMNELLIVDSLHDGLVRPSTFLASEHSKGALTRQQINDRLAEWGEKYRDATAPATVKAVRADWMVFVDWCERAGTWALPVATSDLVKFLTDQVVLGKKRSTLNRYLSTIRLIHRAISLPDPTNDPDWKLEWKGIVKRLAEAQANAPEQAEPLRSDAVRHILSTLTETPLDLRDAALISLASDTLCRESELVSIKREQIRRSGNAWAVDLRRSKTDQEGLGTSRYCSPETKARIDKWCTAAGIKRGHMFIPVGRAKAFTAPEPGQRKPLEPPEVARIIRRRAMRAGIPSADLLTGHSGRVGSAVELLEAGYSVTDVQFAGGWRSPKMVLHYGKQALAGRNAMAQLRQRQAKASEDSSE